MSMHRDFEESPKALFIRRLGLEGSEWVVEKDSHFLFDFHLHIHDPFDYAYPAQFNSDFEEDAEELILQMQEQYQYHESLGRNKYDIKQWLSEYCEYRRNLNRDSMYDFIDIQPKPTSKPFIISVVVCFDDVTVLIRDRRNDRWGVAFSNRYQSMAVCDGMIEDVEAPDEDGLISLHFDKAGIYRIGIYGHVDGLDFADAMIDHTYIYYFKDVEQWGDNQWKYMDGMFAGCKKMNITASDVPDLSLVRDMSNMFWGAESMNAPLNDWDVSQVQDMSGMFCGAKSFNMPLNRWDVSNVTDMEDMFMNAIRFNQPIGNWNTGRVSNMRGMFKRAMYFNQPIGEWDTAQVADMGEMFAFAKRFNQPIDRWNTELVMDMDSMFAYTDAFDQPIGRWNTQNVISMRDMFLCAFQYNQPLEAWDTRRVTDMRGMLMYASRFDQPVMHWNMSKVEHTDAMFYHAEMFNQPVEQWNLSNLHSMKDMFAYASHFYQSITGWYDSLNNNILDHIVDFLFGTSKLRWFNERGEFGYIIV